MEYSRLTRKRARQSRSQLLLFAILTIFVLFLLVKMGLPLVFTISERILQLKHGEATNVITSSLEIPSTPIISANYLATSSAFVKISGNAEPESTVTIASTKQQETTLADSQGHFSLDLTLQEGKNEFSAFATTKAGKRSPKSEILEVRYLTRPPKLEITSVKDGDTTNQDSILVSGKTDPQTTVLVNDHVIVIRTDGSFDIFVRLTRVDNKLKVEAADPAGNKTSQELTIKYTTP